MPGRRPRDGQPIGFISCTSLASAENPRLGETRSDDLQPDRQAVGGEAAGPRPPAGRHSVMRKVGAIQSI